MTAAWINGAVSPADLRSSAQRIAELERALERARAQHEELIHRAVHDGAALAQVAAEAEVTAAFVRQVARRPRWGPTA